MAVDLSLTPLEGHSRCPHGPCCGVDAEVPGRTRAALDPELFVTSCCGKRLGARAEAFRSLNREQCCEGHRADLQTIVQNLLSKAFFFFLPSKVEICSTDKSNAFRENNSKAFLANSSPSEHQATIVPRYSQLGMTS